MVHICSDIANDTIRLLNYISMKRKVVTIYISQINLGNQHLRLIINISRFDEYTYKFVSNPYYIGMKSEQKIMWWCIYLVVNHSEFRRTSCNFLKTPEMIQLVSLLCEYRFKWGSVYENGAALLGTCAAYRTTLVCMSTLSIVMICTFW